VRKALSIGSFTAADEYAGLRMPSSWPARRRTSICTFLPSRRRAATALALRAENAARALDARIANSKVLAYRAALGTAFTPTPTASSVRIHEHLLDELQRRREIQWLSRARLLVHGEPQS